jgi:CRISPR-associated protein Csx14
LGDHAAIVTEAYQILKQQGVKLTSVAWIYPGSNNRITGLSNVLKRVLDKEQVETLPVPLVGCEDVDSQVECDRFLEKTLEQITVFSERQYAVHLSLAGGRKAMAAMMFLAAQKTRVAGLYHVLLNDSEVEQQLLHDTSYEALCSTSPNKQRQLLLMDDKKIEQVVDLINIPSLTNEAVG